MWEGSPIMGRFGERCLFSVRYFCHVRETHYLREHNNSTSIYGRNPYYPLIDSIQRHFRHVGNRHYIS